MKNAYNKVAENDNFEFEVNSGEFGLTSIEAARLLIGAYYSDEYNALYNDEGWVITVNNGEYEFASENGFFFENFNKVKIDLIAKNI